MERSLLDDEYVIQRAAMDCLLNDSLFGYSILKKYVAKNPLARISSIIRLELERKGVQP